jgi:hypothetical protein
MTILILINLHQKAKFKQPFLHQKAKFKVPFLHQKAKFKKGDIHLAQISCRADRGSLNI